MPTFLPARPGKRPERATATPEATPRRAPPALLTVKQVADHLGASTRHVRRLAERGLLPVHRFGRLVRVSPDDLARLIAASRES
jgi:excisionase family DNA binding protein